MKIAPLPPTNCQPITVDSRTMPYLPHDGQELRTLAAAGMSLHLFTEMLINQHGFDMADLKDATSILTAQLDDVLRQSESEWPNIVLDLVIDPRRVAGSNGATAAEFCGSAWTDVVRLAEERAAAAVHAAVEPRVILRLAAARAFGSDWCCVWPMGQTA